MREGIGLFRGRRVDGQGWVEGCLYLFPDGIAYILTSTTDPEYVGTVEVDPETVGEFTGLHDKNGKRIFEGDLVSNNKCALRSAESRKYVMREVVFDHGAWMFNRIAGESRMDKKLMAYGVCGLGYEIIDNVHEKEAEDEA